MLSHWCILPQERKCRSGNRVTQRVFLTVCLSFLTKRHINVAVEHQHFAKICLSYLSVDGISASLAGEAIEANIMDGRYAFFDYAASHWLDHLIIRVANPPTPEVSLDPLSRAIRRFLDQHFRSITPKKIPPNFTKVFDPRPIFGHEDFLDTLTQVAYNWSLHFAKRSSRQKGEPIATEDPELNELDQALELECFIPRLRFSLDRIAQRLKDSTRLQQVQQYHGLGLFKCRFVHCDYFYIGFGEKATRDSHQGKHDRPFFCRFGGCPYGITGFTSARSLETHINNIHTPRDLFDPGQGAHFPVLDDPKSIVISQAVSDGNLPAVRRWAEQFNGPIPLERLGTRRHSAWGVDTSYKLQGHSSLVLTIVWDNNDLEMLKYLVENSEDIELAKMASLRVAFSRSRWPEAEDWIFSSPSTLANTGALHHTLKYRGLNRDEVLCLRTLKHYRRSLNPSRKFSGLHMMVKRGFLSCVRFLVLQCQLDANHVHKKTTALMEAAEAGRHEIVRFLLEENHCTQATIDHDCGKGTAAKLAAANGHELVISILAAYTAPEVVRSLTDIAQLRQAAIIGDSDAVAKSINLGVPIDVPDSHLYTPFHHAVENGHCGTAKVFLDQAGKMIPINQMYRSHHPGICCRKRWISSEGATALAAACINGNEDMVRLLLKRPDINTNKEIPISRPFLKARKCTLASYFMTCSELVEALGFQKIKVLLDEHEKSGQPPSEQIKEDAAGGSRKFSNDSGNDSDIATGESSGEDESD